MNLEFFVNKAKEMLQLDGYHVPIVLCFDKKNQLTPIIFNNTNDEEKYKCIQEIKTIIKEKNIIKYFSIIEAYQRTANNLKEAKYMQDNWDTEQPSAYPDSMRQEVLVISEMNKNHTGKTTSVEFKKIDGKITFQGENSIIINEDNPASGQMANYFK